VTAIIVARYDRTSSPDIRRVHQEDMCQALRVHPARKYQNDGGPGPRQIVNLLRANSSDQEDVLTFVDALVFNWLIGGSDAHAKNYSLLIGRDGIVRLAPLYDIASIFAYADIDPQKVKMAMKIGADYRLRDIGWANWYDFARETAIDRDVLISRAERMARNLPEMLAAEVASAHQSGLSHPAIERLARGLEQRAGSLIRS
jgi:serine/threonine-protein kinase HipA